MQPRLKILNPFQVYLLVMVRASSALAAPASGRLQSALALALASALAPAFAAASTFTALHLSIIACKSASLKRAAELHEAAIFVSSFRLEASPRARAISRMSASTWLRLSTVPSDIAAATLRGARAAAHPA